MCSRTSVGATLFLCAQNTWNRLCSHTREYAFSRSLP